MPQRRNSLPIQMIMGTGNQYPENHSQSWFVRPLRSEVIKRVFYEKAELDFMTNWAVWLLHSISKEAQSIEEKFSEM